MSDKPSDASASDHAYFQDLEAAFIRLRGAPLLLSPADWQVAKRWRREGVPLELVVRVMERVFERQAEPDKKAGIRSLRYFRSAVAGAWQRILELGGGEKERLAEPVDIAARLERLAAALPTRAGLLEASAGGSDRLSDLLGAALAGAIAEPVEELAKKILSLTGSARTVEAELQRLDRAFMERLREELDAPTLAALEESLQDSLAGLSERMGGDIRDQTLGLLLRRRLRQELELPVLSLFSSEARSPR